MTSKEKIERRGYLPVYHPNEANRCLGCSRSHWLVGRQSAECAFCGFVLPLEESVSGSGLFTSRGRRHV